MVSVAMKFDKRFFFDRKAVASLIGKQAVKVLGKAAARVRLRARGSMRRAGKKLRASGKRTPSAPGTPPRAWSTDKTATLKNIQYAFEPSRWSVFVGPLKLNGSSGVVVPGLHELGGSTKVPEWRYLPNKFRNFSAVRRANGNEWRPSSQRRINRLHARQSNVESRVRTATYPERPFMGPALTKEAPNFPTLFARSA